LLLGVAKRRHHVLGEEGLVEGGPREEAGSTDGGQDSDDRDPEREFHQRHASTEVAWNDSRSAVEASLRAQLAPQRPLHETLEPYGAIVTAPVFEL
jgi:hypothetical protein